MIEGRRPRVLMANVHFAPVSYGGATVIAENMAREFSWKLGWDVLVVTSFYDSRIVPYTMKRYAIGGIQVIAVCVPQQSLSYQQKYVNPEFDKTFRLILESFAPDVVHVHCVQGMGASFFRDMKRLGIPFAVTIHDAWWMCERQFMVTPQQRYCFQTTIDLRVCRYCVEDLGRTKIRKEELTDLLLLADRQLFPSAFFRDLCIANGLPAERCIVNKNGVVGPRPEFFKRRERSRSSGLRFGFVGGPGPNKGAAQMVAAFRAIKSTDYELVIVDAALNAGHSWRHMFDWTVPGRVKFHPAYTKDTMDEFFSQIDVLLFPSQWKESFGLTVREALRRNIWVIATDAGGVAEDCRDGVNATVIAMTSDHVPLQNAIESILGRKDLRDFKNPHMTDVRLVEEQAQELSQLLKTLIKQGTMTVAD
jgi:O-antigen biosynthesis protein